MRALGALKCRKASDKSGPIAPTISGPLERRTTSFLPLAYRARFGVRSGFGPYQKLASERHNVPAGGWLSGGHRSGPTSCPADG